MKKSAIMLVAITSLNGGCFCADVFLYQPGQALADRHGGSMWLATATEESIAATFPKGTAKARVIQFLGSPASSSKGPDGATSQTFRHSFTSFKTKIVQVQTLVVEYDARDAITKTAFSISNDPL